MHTWAIVLLSFVGLIVLVLFYVNFGRWKIDNDMLDHSFNIKSFLDQSWYQYAYLPNKFSKKCKGNITSIYSTMDVINKCDSGTQKGEVYIYSPSKIKVSYVPKILTYIDKFLQLFGDINLFTKDCYVLSTDNINYVMMGSSNLKSLWIMTKDPNYFNIEDNKPLYKRLVAIAGDLYYPVSDLLTSS